MPSIDQRTISAHSRLGLWRMEPSVDDLCAAMPHLLPLKDELQGQHLHAQRLMEKLCTHALLAEMTGQSQLRVGHLPSGKPVVEGFNVSISHTRGYVAMALSEKENVAVDIEYRSDRVARIAHRFIRTDETACNTSDMLAIWSAKETLYKLFSDDNLLFSDMRVHRLDDQQLLIENMKRKVLVSVGIENAPQYVLTWAAVPLPSEVG